MPLLGFVNPYLLGYNPVDMVTLQRTKEQFALYLQIFFMIQAILLPVYGPWLDSGFAAYLPYHDHIYLGQVDPDHDHHPNRPHSHEAPLRNDSKTGRVKILFLDVIIYLPNREANYQAVIFLTSLDDLLDLFIPNSLVFPVTDDLHEVYGLSVPPLKHPPRLLVSFLVKSVQPNWF